MIDPLRPEISARYNPFWAPEGNAEEHVGFVFESFNMEKDFFEGHQRVYLENIARVLHYSGKRFNFHDVLVCAYDQTLLKTQMKVALDQVAVDSTISRQQKLTLTMSVRNLLESFEDKERVSKIQGLINERMTFMGDDMAMITGPNDELLSLDDVIDKGLSVHELERQRERTGCDRAGPDAASESAIDDRQTLFPRGGRRESSVRERHHGRVQPVCLRELRTHLQTARGANVAFLFALQSAPQLLQVGRGFRNDVASAPNTTFMLRTKDEETAQYFLKASARVRQMRRSMRVQKKGVFNPEFEEGTEGSQTEIKDTLAQDEHIKKMPVGQMEILMTDPFRGTIHKHLHIKKACSHCLPQVPMNVYPKLDTVGADSHGLNLSVFRFRISRRRGSGGGGNEALWIPYLSSAALVGSCRWATNAAPGYAIAGNPGAIETKFLRSDGPAERVPFSPKGSSKQLLLGSIHRIRTMELWSRGGAKTCSKRL